MISKSKIKKGGMKFARTSRPIKCDHLAIKYFESKWGCVASNPFCSKCGKELEDC